VIRGQKSKRQMYVVARQVGGDSGAEMPQVFIETVKGGDVNYGVRFAGRTLKSARETAQREFEALRKYVQGIQEERTRESLEKALDAKKLAEGIEVARSAPAKPGNIKAVPASRGETKA
jgi:hypothetical protein